MEIPNQEGSASTSTATSLFPWTVSLKHKTSTSGKAWLGQNPAVHMWRANTIFLVLGAKSELHLNWPCSSFRPTTPVPAGLQEPLFSSTLTYMPLISPHSDSSYLYYYVNFRLEIPLKSSTALNIGKSHQFSGQIAPRHQFLLFCMYEKLCVIVMSHTLLRDFCHLN